MAKSLRVSVWCPDFNGKDGGIQQYSRLLVQAVRQSPSADQCHVLFFGGATAGRVRFALAALVDLFLRRPDLVIVTHLHLARLYPAMRLTRTPYWICAHGIECWPPLGILDRQALAKASRILCVSRHTRTRIAGFLPQAEAHLEVLPNHVETPEPLQPSKTEARTRLRLPQEKFLFLTVSRLSSSERYKGHREMLAALQTLKIECPQVHYAIAGTGDDLPALREIVKSKGLENQVTFLERLDSSQLELAYAACDAYAMPSVGEGFGIVFLEALVRGKPVLAGNLDGSADPLMDGALGVLIDPSNPSDLLSGLRMLIQDAGARNPELLRAAVLESFGTQHLQACIDQRLSEHLDSLCAE